MKILITSTLISLFLLSCSEGELPERKLEVTDYETDSDSDALVLPHQTTGSYLTTSCLWIKRDGFTENQIGCRYEDDKGNKADASTVENKVYQGSTQLDAKVEEAPKDDFWNKIITIDGTVVQNVDVASIIDGKEFDRQSVERLLLHNKGIKSVKRVDNVASFAGFDIPLPKSKIYADSFCDESGNNFSAPTNDRENYPAFYNLPSHMTTYYYEPMKLIEEGMRDFGLPGFARDLVIGAMETACEVLKEGDGALGYLSTKCQKRPERVLAKPIFGSAGFCLRKVEKKEENGRCTVAIFENPTGQVEYSVGAAEDVDTLTEGPDNQYYMAFGNQRLSEIDKDLEELGIQDSVQIYLDTFDKCK